MSNKTIFVQPGGGYHNVVVGSSDVRAPANDEITVRLHANSLNYHDFAVVSGMWGPTEQRIPMADGAGEVVAVGAGVSEKRLATPWSAPSSLNGLTARRWLKVSSLCRVTVLTVMPVRK